jgi:hypothetical protein
LTGSLGREILSTYTEVKRMHKPTLWVLGVLLLVVALGANCSKKESAPTEEIPKDGVSSIPTPAERATDMSPVDLPLAGAVKEVKAKVLDKEADDKTMGLMRIKALALDGPVDVSENTKWELWKPGSDPEEGKPEKEGWADHEDPVPPGTWDIRFHYEESAICKSEGWIRNVSLVAGKLWKAEVVLAAPMQYVRIYGTLKGDDVASEMHVDMFKAGTDEDEFPPLISFWSTQKQAIGAGSYDLRLNYDKDNVKAKAALKNFTVGNDHGIQKKTIALVKQ